jgi:acyl-CoA dehydrogenase
VIVDVADLEVVRTAVRELMKAFPPNYWREVDESRRFPVEFFTAMGEHGYFGTLIDEQDGGSSAGPMVASVVIEEVNRAGGDAATLNAQMAICGVLIRHGSSEQKLVLRDIANGAVRCLGVAATESDSGADMTQLQSVAKRDGDDWIIDAKKMFISMAEHTDLIFLLAAADEGSTLFLVDRRQAGSAIEVRPMPMVVNRMTTALFVDQLRVPDTARIGPVGKGLECLMGGFSLRRILAAAEAIGNARYLLDISLEHARTRETHGRPIGMNQGVQYPLTSAYSKIEAADLMRADALRLLLSGVDAGGRSALAKILASEAAWEMARAAMTTFGGWALTTEMHIERKLRESTVFVFNNLLLSYVAQRVLKLPKSF